MIISFSITDLKAIIVVGYIFQYLLRFLFATQDLIATSFM